MRRERAEELLRGDTCEDGLAYRYYRYGSRWVCSADSLELLGELLESHEKAASDGHDGPETDDFEHAAYEAWADEAGVSEL